MYISRAQQKGDFSSVDSHSFGNADCSVGDLLQQYQQLSSERANILGRFERGTTGGSSTPRPNELGIENEATLVQSLISARRKRSAFFPADLFADPAWDIFLDLYLAELEQRRVMISCVGIAASVPPTTTLRWLNALIERGLITRHPDPLDRRRVYVILTAKSRKAMREYLELI